MCHQTHWEAVQLNLVLRPSCREATVQSDICTQIRVLGYSFCRHAIHWIQTIITSWLSVKLLNCIYGVHFLKEKTRRSSAYWWNTKETSLVCLSQNKYPTPLYSHNIWSYDHMKLFKITSTILNKTDMTKQILYVCIRCRDVPVYMIWWSFHHTFPSYAELWTSDDFPTIHLICFAWAPSTGQSEISLTADGFISYNKFASWGEEIVKG